MSARRGDSRLGTDPMDTKGACYRPWNGGGLSRQGFFVKFS
jgi:hypothetical protein